MGRLSALKSGLPRAAHPADKPSQDDATERAFLRSSLSLVLKKLREDYGITAVHDPLPEEMRVLLDALKLAEQRSGS